MVFDISDILNIIAIIISIGAMVKAFKLYPHEAEEKDANAAKNYADAAIQMAEKAEKAETKVDDQEKEIASLKLAFDALKDATHKETEELKTQIINLRGELRSANTYIIDLLEGIDILLHQLAEKELEPRWKPTPRPSSAHINTKL